MKQILPTLILVFVTIFTASAQNYQLVQPGVIRYFANEDHYLRAARVDSVKSIGSDTVLYLFRTPRGKHLDNNQTPIPLDTNGGSWLGKTIRIQAGGVHIIPNYWGDTVIIRAQAQLNDSWVIYDDTTDYAYEAAVTAVSQTNVLGQPDSVKTITITAKYQNNINSADPLHNGTIRISKNHGLVKSYDLYMFPLHEPGKNTTKGFDYFTDKAGISASNIIAYQSLEAALNDADSLKKYTLNPGDAVAKRASYQSSGMQFAETKMVYDSILSVSQLGKVITYVASGFTTVGYGGNNSTSNGGSPSDAASRYLAMRSGYQTGTPDTIHLPEETWQYSFIWYNPNDTTLCMNSPGYKFYNTNIMGDGRVNTFGPVGGPSEYKLGLGLTRYYYIISPNSPKIYDEHIFFVRRGSKVCGQSPVSVPKTEALQYAVYPNPASDRLIIKKGSKDEVHISVLNMMGQKLATVVTEKQEVSIPVGNFTNGVYYLFIIDNEGHNQTEKFIVQH